MQHVSLKIKKNNNILKIRVAKMTRIRNYEDLCQFCFGNWGYALVSISMLVFDFGAILSYLIILGDAASGVLQIWGYGG